MAGDEVQTSLGKGVVRGARGQGWVLVEIGGRSVVLEERAIGPIDPGGKARAGKTKRPAPEPVWRPAAPSGRSAPAEIDLHGLTVEEALARVETAVNDALLADRSELRVIHGRGSGRIRAALHRWLRDVMAVSAFRLDPRNAGVTIVRF
jgi:dsDNA-specific endonuclease/ATPase MutS2